LLVACCMHSNRGSLGPRREAQLRGGDPPGFEREHTMDT